MATPKKPKIRFITRDDHRLYIHPQTGEFIPGVTSIINNLPKPFLKPWGQKLVAEEAVNKFDQLSRVREADPQVAIDWLKKAPDRFTGQASRYGKIAHSYFEELALGAVVDASSEPEDVRLMVDQYKDFLDTIQPEPILLEEGVWHPELNYAGTFDAIYRFNNPDLIMTDSFGNEMPLVGIGWCDNKTTRSGLHAEVGLQLAAYRHAPYVLAADGTALKNNPGDFALGIHVRPEGWELIPVEAGLEEFEVFKTLIDVDHYLKFHEKNIMHGVLAGNRVRRKRRVASAEKIVAEVTK
jgi:hypothetical protein